jgi:hypothetical protein
MPAEEFKIRKPDPIRAKIGLYQQGLSLYQTLRNIISAKPSDIPRIMISTASGTKIRPC